MTYYAPAAQQPPTRRRSRTWLLIGGLVAVLVVGLAFGRWVVPATTAQQPDGGSSTSAPGGGKLGAPHGPSKITKGVPSGYTQDKTGAASAAANAVQLMVAVAHGQADPETVRGTWIASNADEAARKVLSAGPNTAGDDQTNKLPASTRVTDYNDTAATVEVWVVSVGSTNGGTLTAARWTTVTFQLTWESDWKVRSLRSVAGPEPGENRSGTPALPITNGLYTFYIE